METKFSKLFARFKRDEKGVTLVEYGIALTLAITLGAAALSTLSTDVGNIMAEGSTQLQDALPVN